jgi:MFS family permease
VISFAFSFLFPWLLALLAAQWATGKVKKPPQGRRLTAILAIMSGIIAFVPLEGLPLARWLIGIQANFSFPLIAVVFNKAWEHASGSRLLDRRASMASWVFGLFSGIALYPMALGLGDFDPYAFGWGFSWLFVSLAILTIALLFIKNRFAAVLMACILGYDLNLLESQNLWDYVVDPFFVLFSFAALSTWLIRLVRTSFMGGK